MTQRMTSRSVGLLLGGGLCLALLIMLSIPSAQAADLPPRPTPVPTPIPQATSIPGAATSSSGAFIELQVPGAHSTWWTTIQWQDTAAAWITVTGWQGSFDTISSGIGHKLWWVAPADLGKGPFRWAVYDSKGGQLLATSEPFDLPAKARIKIIVQAAVK